MKTNIKIQNIAKQELSNICGGMCLCATNVAPVKLPKIYDINSCFTQCCIGKLRVDVRLQRLSSYGVLARGVSYFYIPCDSGKGYSCYDMVSSRKSCF